MKRHANRSSNAARLLVTAATLLWLLCPLAGRADEPASAFEAANKLYEEGKFIEAASAYEKLLQSGRPSAALYFNLGNAFFKSSQIGRAIAAYRQAEQLTPRDPDVRANLQFARAQAPGPTLPRNRWEQWLAKLTLNEWTLLTTSAFWLWLLLLAVRKWRPKLQSSFRAAVVLFALTTVISGACLAADWNQTRSKNVAIVTKKDAVVHNGPLEESPTAFTAHDGAELRVLDHKDEWLEVSAGLRRTGWLHCDQVLLSN